MRSCIVDAIDWATARWQLGSAIHRPSTREKSPEQPEAANALVVPIPSAIADSANTNLFIFQLLFSPLNERALVEKLRRTWVWNPSETNA
jgi:hypothetical protein